MSSITNLIPSSVIAGASVLAYTPTAASPYVVLDADYTIGVDCSLAIKTVHLPNAPATGQIWRIKDVTGNSAIFNITITTPGGVVLIDDAATYVLNVAYACVCLQFTGTKFILL